MTNILMIVDAEGLEGYSDKLKADELSNLITKYVCSIINSLINYYENSVITVLDIHGTCNNIDANKVREFYRYTKVVNLWTLYQFKYDFAILLGFHSSLNFSYQYNHTFRKEYSEIKLNGKLIGEIGIFLQFLYELNIPILAIQGNMDSEIEFSSFFNKQRIEHRQFYKISESENELINCMESGPIYIDSEMGQLRIEFICPQILEFLPRFLNNYVNSNSLEFDNVRSFMNYILYISLAINHFNVFYNIGTQKTKLLKKIIENRYCENDDRLFDINRECNNVNSVFKYIQYLEDKFSNDL